MELLVLGDNNREISNQIQVPLSTIQRRVRNLIANEVILFTSHINFEKFGFKMGLLHIYLKEGDIGETAKNINEIEGIESVEGYIGNSDLIANVIYKYSKQLLEIISKVKENKTVEKIVWSEMIYKIQSKNNPIQFTRKAI